MGYQHKNLNQPHSPGGRIQKGEEMQFCSLQKGDHKHTQSDQMRWQRNMLQIKEHGKNPQEQLNEEKTDNLAEKEFRVMRVKMIQDLRNRWSYG